MRRSDVPLSCARVQVLLEPYVDGDLGPAREQRVRAHLQLCGECATACEAARELRLSLRQLPQLEAPAAVWQQRPIGSEANRASGRSRQLWDALRGHGMGAGWLRPAGAMAAVLLLLFLWVQQRQPLSPQVSPSVSQAELLHAEQQARWALAYLTRVSTYAGDTAFFHVGDVVGEAIGVHAIGSVTDAVGRSLQPSSDAQKPGVPEEEVQAP